MTDASTVSSRYRTVVAEAVPELDQRLSNEHDAVHAAATAGVPAARELTVRVLDASGELPVGMSGWATRSP